MLRISKQHVYLFAVLLVAIILRLTGINWDSNFHLHPDERFLTMVANAMKLPLTWKDYINPAVSTFNPVNIGFGFFVYGTLPLITGKLMALVLSMDMYNSFTILGRFLSAVADVAVIIVIYKMVELVEQRYKIPTSLKLWAGFLYAIAVLPIQLSHFFAVDTFMNLAMLLSFYFSLRYFFNKNLLNIILSAICMGLAFACKVSAIYIFPLNMVLIFVSVCQLHLLIKNRNYRQWQFITARILTFGGYVLVYMIGIYITLRLTDPYIFANSNFFDMNLNKSFIGSLQSLKSFESTEGYYPPSIQWFTKPPIIFSLGNMAILGLGIPYFLLIINSAIQYFRQNKGILKHWLDHLPLLLVIFWVLGFFFYQSVQFTKAMRYFIFLYPFLAIFAAYGLLQVIAYIRKHVPNNRLMVIAITIVMILLIHWPLAFSSIYIHKHSRVAASEWIYQHIPNNSYILGESWDDALPLAMPINQNTYHIDLLPVFDPDTPEKWQKMDSLLQQADYYILSSNRGWGSISTVPWKYPQMSQFYKDLFAGKTNYKLIKTFSSYPSLNYLGIPFTLPDQWSDETFTVYDHPLVMIFQKL